ncbi:unnamed protein product [Brachionus calyciflorus]|uniref:Uncharacterized protein n=1 Tax=Brachionus calyciflorus TaxID=104777 RepID=A0A813QPL7_9BILA|nr:unnamed protein product [Brachionus calyciflorus]
MASNPKPPPNPLFILQNSKPINCVLFSIYNKNLLYTGNRNGDFNIFDLKLRRSVFIMNLSDEAILSITEIDADNILTHSRNGQIFKWTRIDPKSWKPKCIYHKEAYTFCQFQLSCDKTKLFLPSTESGLIEAIDLTENKRLFELRSNGDLKSNRGMVMCIKIINTQLFLNGFENGEIVLFDLSNQLEKSSINLFNGQPVLSFDFDSKNMIGIAGSAESELKQFSLLNENLEYCFQGGPSVQITNPGVNFIKIRLSDSLIFACGCWDSRIRIFSLKKMRLLAVLDFHKEAINSIDFSIDNLMSAGSSDGIISIWDIFK